ncbi:MAG: carboxypeptidase-like regulatory domain-containing protein [Bacteroidetes bacterium]|nr:carboxypeptidase-like regulatory domain-containing protein [Bacteroidota bacterium]
MKKILLLIFPILLLTSAAKGQEIEVLITSNFNDVSFLQFVDQIEKSYPVNFFFKENDVADISVTGNFNNTAISDCVASILEGKGIHYYIKNNQVFLYSGKAIGNLFLIQQEKIEEQIAKTKEQVSREGLLAKQYELLNIGVPGLEKSGYAEITGKVSVFNTNYPLPGCNVYTLENQKGTATDKDGVYNLRLPLGNHTLVYSSVGMESTKRQLNLYSNGNLNVELETKVNLLSDVEIMGDNQGNLNRVQIGMERIDMKSVKNLPKLLGESDIFKSALILPGVLTVGEGASGFNVRGGKTDQNLILIDQTPIYYPSHFFGNFSAINSDLVEGAKLYKGSFPVKYGGRISSVYQIDTKGGDFQKIKGVGGISPLSAKLMLEGPIKKDKSSFLLSFRSTYSDWILRQVTVDQLYNSSVDFYDAQVKFSFKLNERTQLTFNGYGSKDGFKLRSDTTYNYNNVLASVKLETKNNGKWQMINSLSYSSFGYNISGDTDSLRSFEMIHTLKNISYKNNVEFSLKENLKLNIGGETQLYFINPGERNVPTQSELTPFHTNIERGLEYGIFAGGEFNPFKRLKIDGGIRLAGYFSLADGDKNIYLNGAPRTENNLIETVETDLNSIQKHYIYPEFRFSSNYSLSRYTSLKLSYNITSQFLHMLTNTTAISPTDTWKLSDEYLKPQRGQAISAGFVRTNYRNTVEMSVEGFYKRMYNIKEYKAGADLVLNDHIETEILDGNGKSYGAEFSLQKNGGRFYGRMGYTYSRTLIKTESEFEEELINDGEYFPANYDKPHNLNVLANFEPIRGIVLSFMLNYSTGRPITYPVAKYKLGDQVILQYSDYNQFRIPDYFRMDASLTIDRNLRKDKLIDGSISFSVYNLTGRKNAYSVYFRSEGSHYEGYKLSIFGTVIPTITYNFKF